MAMLTKNTTPSLSSRPRRKSAHAVSLESSQLVRFRPYYPDKSIPLLAEPAMEGVVLSDWVNKNFELLNQKLYDHGVVVFRGFNFKGEDRFAVFMDSLPHDRLPYLEGSTPRKEVARRVYTSTLFPQDESIALHSELSSSTKFPKKLWFFCAHPTATGGETPVGDARRVLERLPSEILDRFERKGWLLIRSYGGGLGLPWRHAFGMDTREELDAYAKTVNIELDWRGEDRLRTRQVRSAVITHPVTGDRAWFNHMSFWHTANLRDGVLDEMVRAVGSEGLPYATFYGDGEPIPDEVAKAVRDAYRAERVKFTWQKDDLMVIDNILSLHGREPYTGLRKIRVAMTESYQRPEFKPEP